MAHGRMSRIDASLLVKFLLKFVHSFLVPTKQDAIDASVDCHNMGGWLVTVFDQNDENVFYGELKLYSQMKLLGNAEAIPFFIGLNDISKNGTWIWDQPIGKTLTVYSDLKLKTNFLARRY
jgi:hypothetical protein